MARAVVSMAAVAAALSTGLLFPDAATAQLAYEVLRGFPAELASPQARLLQGTDGAFYGTTAGRPPNGGATSHPGGIPTIFTLRPQAGGGYGLAILHEFLWEDGPAASLIQALDGHLYGTTMGSGVGDGMVFKISPAGAFTVLHAFTVTDGYRPLGGLVQATDGNFYGTTSLGGPGVGTVFRVTTDGTLTTLHAFTGGSDGEKPIAGLIQATDGGLYGITQTTIFRITTDGAFTTVYTFSGFDQPLGRLVQGTDGDFYGVTSPGFFVDRVKAFKVTAGGILTYLHTFTEGSPSPFFESYEPLMQASDGNFYGTLSVGGIGPLFGGTAYRMTPAGDVTVLHSFTDAEGVVPLAGLRQAQDGRLYGVTSEGGPLGRGTVFSLDLAGAFATVHAFQSQEGCGPWGALVQTSDDAFYGTTLTGGLANKGTVYRMTGDGTVTTLHSFTGLDGAFPMASLLLASDGNFYGTTANGGTSDQGTVFRMTPAGVVTALHSFAGSDGALPWAPLIEVSAGNLHGTTTMGGSSNLGTLFRISLSGNFVSYHSFTLAGPNSPAHPVGPLLRARDGSLYGTAFGFQDVGPYARGSVFKVTPGGVVVLSSGFTSNHITAGLTEGSDGNFYSTSFGDHTWPFPGGSVFKTTPQGVRTVLRYLSFLTDGMRPFNAPIEASDGNFYGTTDQQLGATGSIYQVTPGGVFTTLKVLSEADGGQPAAKLLQASDGAVYGAAFSGGSGGCGLVFRFAIP